MSWRCDTPLFHSLTSSWKSSQRCWTQLFSHRASSSWLCIWYNILHNQEHNERLQIWLGLFSIISGDSTCGQRAVYQLGMTGIPIYNASQLFFNGQTLSPFLLSLCTQVNNACSTGSSALLLAQQLVQGGIARCVMALGFEKMERGSLTAKVWCNY